MTVARIIIASVLAIPLTPLTLTAASTRSSVEIDRGICVVLGDDAPAKAVELAHRTQATIFVQVTEPGDFTAACKAIDAEGLYGTRVFVARGPADRLILADNIVDCLISPDPSPVPRREILRVLHPGAVATIGDKVLTRPPQAGVDDWSHPYHGPDNNPQSADRVIVGPYLTQFLADPRYAPIPQVAVASAGRVFKAFGHVAFKEREEPWLNKLVAFNGYNGALLWFREITPGIMVHRNTIIATADTLYYADDKSCKLIDPATGHIRDEIIPAADVAGGRFWKWIALDGDRLLALLGEGEKLDKVTKWRRDKHGWPWNPIAEGFNAPDGIGDPGAAYRAHPWGFGSDVLAFDPASKKVLWHHHEDTPVDSRAMCAAEGRVFLFAFDSYLTALDTRTGRTLWRKTPQNAPRLFEAIGAYSNRQGASYNWRTTAYVKCTDKALYFAGPTVNATVAVSAETGDLLWRYPYGNFQLVIRDNGLYAIAGQNDTGKPSFIFDPLTGDQLGKLDIGRRACTRPTASSDSIFFRARGGSTRFDIADAAPRIISPMRPPCFDGVTIANGLLYWWPYVCDCQLTLYGITALAPAGDFDFTAEPTDADRLCRVSSADKLAALPVSDADWPTFRADNQCTASTTARIADTARVLWTVKPPTIFNEGAPHPTAPTAAAGLVFAAGPDGIVRAFNARTGDLAWKAFTGGPVRYPPTISDGRAYVAASDGYLHCLEAATGRVLWRFRAAPVERRIPVYGSIASTWPAAAVLVDNGTAYVAAGIVNYDGTCIYALDAATGRIKWRNNTSGHLDRAASSGVSVQGHLLLHEGRLYMPGGNAVSPAVYDASTGKCLNDPAAVQLVTQNNVLLTLAPRGAELTLLGDYVTACGSPFYAHPRYQVYDISVFNRAFLSTAAGRSVLWTTDQTNSRIAAYSAIDKNAVTASLKATANNLALSPRRLGLKGRPQWAYDSGPTRAVACASNAVVVAEPESLVALKPTDGAELFRIPLSKPPVDWGLAIDSAGRIIVTATDGSITCIGK